MKGHNYEHGKGNICRKCGKIHKAWNKNLTKETDKRVAKYAEKTSLTRRKLFTEGKLEQCRLLGNKNPMKRPEIKELFTGNKNPMKNLEIARKNALAKIGKPRYDIRGKNNPMKKFEIRAKFKGDKNPSKRPEVRAKLKKNHWSKKEKSYIISKKISLTKIGDKNPSKKFEVRKKISTAHQGIPLSEWKGFVGSNSYSIEFNKQLKEYIRNKYGRTCQLCGFEKNGRKLAIHHIDYNRKNCSKKNLIPLCKSCNSKVNYNRNYWESYFKKYV